MTTLLEAKDTLREQVIAGDAVTCPCCTQLAKIYKRQIYARMAVALIRIYRHGGDENGWLHVPSLLRERGFADTTKLSYWGLIEPMPNVERDDGSTRTGWWRITGTGRAFVRRQTTMPKYAHVYDGRVLRHDGAPMTIDDALGKGFDYDELMSA